MADQLGDSIFKGGYDEERPNPLHKWLPEEEDENNGDELAKTTMPPVGRELSEQEKKLKKVAGRISLLQKIANPVKAMIYAWASFVLLGAFSNNLAMRDFWFATAALLQTKISIFNYKYVIHDWGNQETDSNTNSRFWSCFSRLFSVKRGVIVLVYIGKLSLAIFCLYKTIVVPSRVLVDQGQDENTAVARNKKYSLVLFYCLVILESVVFLAENVYYSKVVVSREFQKVSSELGFRKDDLIPVHGFFIDCVTSSSDAERDMVTFGVDLMASDLHDKQLVGVRILSTFVSNSPNDFSRKVLINIGANLKALKALVGILDNCRLDDDDDDNHESFNTWKSTATVLSKLTTVEENIVRVDQMPASMQIICSHLLKKGRSGSKWNTAWRLESEILANLAKEEESKVRIGRTSSGGVLKKLLRIFFKGSCNDDAEDTRDAVGNAIVMLTFEGESNCRRILKLNLFTRFIQAALFRELGPVFGLHAKKVLRNLCMYSGASCDDDQLIGIIQEAPKVFKMIVDEDVSSEEGKKIIVGIAACTCKSKTLEKSTVAQFGVSEDRLAAELIDLIKCKSDDDDPILVKSVIEVASWMITNSPRIVHTFVEKDLEGILKRILDNADEAVSDDFELQFLVDKALELLMK